MREVIGRCACLTGNKGYDCTKITAKLWDRYGIEPMIDIQNLWKDGEETKLVRGRRNVIHDYKWTVYCCWSKGREREMVAGGFEKDRKTSKYLCHAQRYGKRTSVERVNRRIDRLLGFGAHHIRGLIQTNRGCSLALVTMPAMASDRTRNKQEGKLRILVQAA